MGGKVVEVAFCQCVHEVVVNGQGEAPEVSSKTIMIGTPPEDNGRVPWPRREFLSSTCPPPRVPVGKGAAVRLLSREILIQGFADDGGKGFVAGMSKLF